MQTLGLMIQIGNHMSVAMEDNDHCQEFDAISLYYEKHLRDLIVKMHCY